MNEYAVEVERINGNVASTYTALSEMGATMPAQQNSDNLPGTVRTVPQGGGKTVQTDWNQMDETAPDFLKNKPFGDEETVVVPFGETEFVFSEADGGAVCYVGIDFVPLIDDALKVFWGEDVYKCGLVSVYGMLAFGNLVMMTGIDTGEPFLGVVMESALAVFDLTSDETGTRLFGLSYVKKEKIDPAYIPPVLTKFYISDSADQYIYLDSGCTQKANKNIVLEKLQRGVVVLSLYDVAVLWVTSYQTSDRAITLFAFSGTEIKKYYAEN